MFTECCCGLHCFKVNKRGFGRAPAGTDRWKISGRVQAISVTRYVNHQWASRRVARSGRSLMRALLEVNVLIALLDAGHCA